MKAFAELVIDDKGRPSVWLEDAKTSAILYASRVHGVMASLITSWEARQIAKEAYERGPGGGSDYPHLARDSRSFCLLLRPTQSV